MAPDAILTAGEDLPAPIVHALGPGHVVGFTRTAPGKTTENEDAFAIVPLGEARGIFAVADGMGGHRAGSEASRVALLTLMETLDGQGEPEGLRGLVLDGFDRANAAVIALGLGAGTTLAVVEIEGARLRTYHAGDSGILVTGQRGRIKGQTLGHSPTNYAVEAGFLDEREALHHAERHVIFNAIGSDDLRVEMSSWIPVAPRDTVIAASDGLFDNLVTEDIVELVRKGPTLRCVTRLASRCCEHMEGRVPNVTPRPDDCTLLVYRHGPPAPARRSRSGSP